MEFLKGGDALDVYSQKSVAIVSKIVGWCDFVQLGATCIMTAMIAF